MADAYASPLIVKPDGSSTSLKRLPVSGAGEAGKYDEAWLQELLYRHPEALPLAELDDTFVRAVPLCRELQTSAGSVDVVYMTRTGRLVVLEAKLWRNPEARRKVIGQILDYATDLSRWDFDRLDEAVRRARAASKAPAPGGLMEALKVKPGGREEVEFRDAVAGNLRHGEMLLLIVGDGIREGAGAIAGFLERHASLHFTFGLVEMAVFGMPDGGHLVQPRILAQSEIARRIVVDVRGGAADISERPLEDDEDAPPRPTEELQRSRDRFEAFWHAFLEKLRLRDGNQPLPPPSKTANLYLVLPDWSTAWVSAYLLQSQERAGVYLTFPKTAKAKRVYDALLADRKAIDAELGVDVEWESDGTKHWIASWGTFPSGTLVETHAAEVHALLAERLDRFVTVFRPRLLKLARDFAQS